VIDYLTYYDFRGKYYLTKPQHLRFGQAFCNKFSVEDKHNLFYIAGNKIAEDIIIQHYVKG
jgi:hypothetical protein